MQVRNRWQRRTRTNLSNWRPPEQANRFAWIRRRTIIQKESRPLGLLSFCYYCTLRKTSGNGLLHVELTNAAGSIRQHSTLSRPTQHVALTDSPRFVYWNLMPKSVQKRKIIYHLAIYHLPFDTFCRRTAAVTCWLSACIRFERISSEKRLKPCLRPFSSKFGDLFKMLV